MIICSCARISTNDVKRAIEWMRAADPQAVVTPGKVYRALGKQPDCGGCIRLLVDEMRSALASDLPMELRALRGDTGRRESHEGRRESHRISKQGVAQ